MVVGGISSVAAVTFKSLISANFNAILSAYGDFMGGEGLTRL
jgi:hypothetical protein